MNAKLMCVVVAALAACSVPAKAPKVEAPDAGISVALKSIAESARRVERLEAAKRASDTAILRLRETEANPTPENVARAQEALAAFDAALAASGADAKPAPAVKPAAETWNIAGKCAAPGIWCGAWVSSKERFESAGCIPFAPCVAQQKPAPAAGK